MTGASWNCRPGVGSPRRSGRRSACPARVLRPRSGASGRTAVPVASGRTSAAPRIGGSASAVVPAAVVPAALFLFLLFLPQLFLPQSFLQVLFGLALDSGRDAVLFVLR